MGKTICTWSSWQLIVWPLLWHAHLINLLSCSSYYSSLPSPSFYLPCFCLTSNFVILTFFILLLFLSFHEHLLSISKGQNILPSSVLRPYRACCSMAVGMTMFSGRLMGRDWDFIYQQWGSIVIFWIRMRWKGERDSPKNESFWIQMKGEWEGKETDDSRIIQEIVCVLF